MRIHHYQMTVEIVWTTSPSGRKMAENGGLMGVKTGEKCDKRPMFPVFPEAADLPISSLYKTKYPVSGWENRGNPFRGHVHWGEPKGGHVLIWAAMRTCVSCCVLLCRVVSSRVMSCDVMSCIVLCGGRIGNAWAAWGNTPCGKWFEAAMSPW